MSERDDLLQDAKAKTREALLYGIKARAIELARAGDLVHAVSLVAHETPLHETTIMDPAMLTAGMLKAMNDDAKGVLAWIEGLS